MIEMCYYYTTTGYPDFKPKCLANSNFKAGLRCHSKNDCPAYMVVLDEYGFYQSAESYKSELDEIYRTKPSGKITVLNVPPAGSFFYCLFREAKGKKSPEQWLTEYPQDISSEFPD